MDLWCSEAEIRLIVFNIRHFEYGGASGRLSWRPSEIEIVWYGQYMGQIWCSWKNLNQNIPKLPDYHYHSWKQGLRNDRREMEEARTVVRGWVWVEYRKICWFWVYILLVGERTKIVAVGHFEPGDLVFWWVSRPHSLTHLCHKSAPHLLWVQKFRAGCVKKCDAGIQNGHQSTILDPIAPIIEHLGDIHQPYMPNLKTKI